MKEPIISFETAKLAFEKGYPVFNNYSKSNFYNRRTKNLIYFGRTGHQTKEHLYGAPTQSLLQKWLREIHKLHIIINPYQNEFLDYTLTVLTQHERAMGGFEEEGSYITYERALEKGLQGALKILA